MKKFLCVAVALCLAQGFSMSSAMAAKTMKLGIVTNKDRSLSKGLVKFGQIVEKETKGEIKVQVFTDGKMVEGTWKREADNSPAQYIDLNGN